MKKVEAIIKPFRLDDVKEALTGAGIIGMTVAEAMADKVVALITAAAKTGSIGDGKVFVAPLEEALRIRTGERGDNAV